jgi:hypothetical protein
VPIYTFECSFCHHYEEVVRVVNRRNDFRPCPSPKCANRPMKRIPARFNAKTFEPYYDEGLGSDVHSESDRRRLMKEMNLVEAGDPVHGGRNFDAKAPNLVEKTALKGKRKRMHRELDTSEVFTVDGEGKDVDGGRFCDLPGLDEGSRLGAKVILPNNQKEL